MKKTIETSFKRIETKYIIAKDDVKDLIKDLKEYVVEDDYPTSTISNIYFDTENFDVIQDALAKQHRREKIRMRTYIETPQADSPVFLEVKSKDEEGIGHKFRLVAKSHYQLDDRWDSRSADTRSRLSARDSEIAQTLWSSIGTTDVHLL